MTEQEHHRLAELATPRRMVLVLAAAVALAFGVGALIGKGAGYGELAGRLREADAWWFLLCLGGEVVAYTGYVIVFRDVAALDGGPRFGAFATTVVVFASLGATRIVAAAGAGGLAVFYWVLRRAGVRRADAVERLLALNILLFAVFGAGGAVAALARGVTGGEAPSWLLATWLAVVPVCFAGAAFVSAPHRAEQIRTRRDTRLRALLAGAVDALVLVRRLPPSAPVGAVLYWAGDVACLWAGLAAFGVHLTPDAVVLAYATGYVATLLPLPFSGVGGVDAAMTFAAVAVGVPLGAALLGVFAYRVFNFWLPTLPALVALIALPRVRLT